MTSVLVNKKNIQSDQSSAESDTTQIVTKGGGTVSSHPLRIKPKPTVTVATKFPPVATVKPKEELPAKSSGFQGSLGCWQDKIMAIAATPATAVVRPVVVAAAAPKDEVDTHHRRRSHSGDRKDKFSIKKAPREPSHSPVKEVAEVKKHSQKKEKKHHSRKEETEENVVVHVQAKKRSNKKQTKVSPAPAVVPTLIEPTPAPVVVPTLVPAPVSNLVVSASPVVQPQPTCTDCNPEGDMCRPITVRDLFKLIKDEKSDKHVRYFARKLLANIKCLPAEVGREFWKDFDYVPTVFSCPPTETCHCGRRRDDCRCVSSDFKVESDGIKMEEFNFHYPSIESKDGEVTLFPLGCGCVPSPLKISEPARFTIYAVKRHLHNNWCCSKCKSPDTCTHQVSKGEDKPVKCEYMIQWVYDRLQRGDDIKEETQRMLCYTLRSFKTSELSADMYEKYCYVHRRLAKDDDEHCHVKPTRDHSRSKHAKNRDSSRSQSTRKSRAHSKEQASHSQSDDSSHNETASRSPVRKSHSRSQSKACTPTKEHSQSATRQQSRSVSRERSHSESKTRAHSKEQRARSKEQRARSKEQRARSKEQRARSKEDNVCHECGYHKSKCKENCPSKKQHRHKSRSKEHHRKDKKECPVPVVPESPFAVFTACGQWVCETVPCSAACNNNVQGVRYRIVLNERDLEHTDGGQVCEGWNLFTEDKFTSVFFQMEPQHLPFYPLTPQIVPDCGC